MTAIIGYQGKDFAVIGTDLCRRDLLGRCSLEDKLKKSKAGSHYIACAGIMSHSEEERLYSKPLDQLISEAFDLQAKPPLTMSANAIIVVPEHNQIYYWGHNPNIKRTLEQNSSIALGADPTRLCDITEKILNEKRLKYVLNTQEIADRLTGVVLLAEEYFPEYVKGAATYIIEKGNIQEYCRLIESAAYSI